MWTKLSKECIDQLWENWVAYFNARSKAVEEVAHEAMDSYVDYANTYYVDDDEEYEDGERWLERKDEEISSWCKECYAELREEETKFRRFLNDLGNQRFGGELIGYTMHVYFYERTWLITKSDDQKLKDEFRILFYSMKYTYSWGDNIKRVVQYQTTTPQLNRWRNDD